MSLAKIQLILEWPEHLKTCRGVPRQVEYTVSPLVIPALQLRVPELCKVKADGGTRMAARIHIFDVQREGDPPWRAIYMETEGPTTLDGRKLELAD